MSTSTAFTDRVTVGAARRTVDGYLVADAKVARTGVQEYLGSEVGRPDMAVVRVYRPAEEVFSDATMKSFAHRPMTNDHPPEHVTADNWKKYAVGQTGAEVVRDGEFVRVQLVLMDKATIAAWETGKRQLSMGYNAEIHFESGTTPDGQVYDAVQRKISNNHLSLVDAARGGSQLQIDSAPNQAADFLKQLTDGGLSAAEAGPLAIQLAANAAAGQRILAKATQDAAVVRDHAQRYSQSHGSRGVSDAAANPAAAAYAEMCAQLHCDSAR